MRRAFLVVLGVYVCLLGAVVHRQVWDAAGVTWPWGLVVAIVVTGLVTIAADEAICVGGAWIALGWAAALLSLQWSPGGSYLVASDSLGLVFTAGSLGAIVLPILVRTRLRP